VERVQKAIIAALKDPAVKQRMAAQGLYPSGTSSADFTKQIASEVAKMKKLAAVANIHLD
jgi:tripartite-type tricarboxylate transporter receptor subunit TctC